MFGKEKIVYQDVLHEWRKIKCGEYYLFDKVIITEVQISVDERYVGQEALITDFSAEDKEEGNSGYELLLKSGKIFYKWEKIKFKKSYGEFQEEFEAMQEVEKKAQELKELENKMEKVAGELIEYWDKASKIKMHNINDIHNKINPGNK